MDNVWNGCGAASSNLKAYQNGTEARKGIGAYLAFYNQERPHQAGHISVKQTNCEHKQRQEHKCKEASQFSSLSLILLATLTPIISLIKSVVLRWYPKVLEFRLFHFLVGQSLSSGSDP